MNWYKSLPTTTIYSDFRCNSMRQQLVLSLNKSLFEKTDFVVADQTEYTFNVDETAAEMLHSEISPDRLF